MTGTEATTAISRRRAARLLLLPPAGLALAGIQSFQALFAPGAELWPRWQANDPGSTFRVDHALWDGFLRRYRRAGSADGIARVAYAAVTAADRTALAGYLEGLAATAVDTLAPGEQRAYWVNLYNALTVRLVLEHWPVASIRDIDISPGLFANGPWDAPLIEVEGVALTLNDIEHRILRPIWPDPRNHYALNCAALGCPDQPPQAFTAADTEALLETAARGFVNHPRGVRVEGGRVTVSSLYVWFAEDFGGSDAAILAHLGRYAAPPLRAALEGIEAIADHDYDWALNASPV